MSNEQPVLLVVRHVPWEGPGRILDACGALAVREVCVLDGDPLPGHGEVSGALVMGGPMNVDEVERHPGLRAERDWLAEAVGGGMPVLGICLGAQLLARALGAEVRPGEGPEIGFAPVRVEDPTDPVLGALAPQSEVLHWHGDVMSLPPGAVRLAHSGPTAVQAFRSGSAWGVLFHAEADSALVDAWLAEPTMAAEATEALGHDAPDRLRARAAELEEELVRRSTPGFQAFADLVVNASADASTGRVDTASRVVSASPERVYAALVDPEALAAWLPPEGMAGRFEWFDPRPGGGYRLVLKYADPSGHRGKATAGSDVVEARFIEMVEGRKVVQEVELVSEDPAFSGTMRMTWEVGAIRGGTRVEIRAENVPPGISPEEHAAGLESSLANLAAHLT